MIFTLLMTFNANALDLFKANYSVFKEGKKIGRSIIHLTKDDPFYTITDKTDGTHGMASFLGFKRSEKTLFTSNNGMLSPESYKMSQKVAFNKRSSSYQIDKENNEVNGNYKGDDWQLKTQQAFLTPNLVSLKLFLDVCAGKKDNLNYRVLKKGSLHDYQFKITSENKNIIEVDKVHSKASRVTKLWLDTNQHCLPIRTYHIEEGEDSLETKLLSFEIQI